MENTENRLAKILNYIKYYFPNSHYVINFTTTSKDTWQFNVIGTRTGRISGDTNHTVYASVEGKDFDSLPEQLFLKTKSRIDNYIKESMDVIEEKKKELEKARDELNKRLLADMAYQEIGQTLIRNDNV